MTLIGNNLRFTVQLNSWNGYEIRLDMLMALPEAILKRMQNAKREAMAKTVKVLYTSEETGCGMSTPC